MAVFTITRCGSSSSTLRTTNIISSKSVSSSNSSTATADVSSSQRTTTTSNSVLSLSNVVGTGIVSIFFVTLCIHSHLNSSHCWIHSHQIISHNVKNTDENAYIVLREKLLTIPVPTTYPNTISSSTIILLLLLVIHNKAHYDCKYSIFTLIIFEIIKAASITISSCAFGDTLC